MPLQPQEQSVAPTRHIEEGTIALALEHHRELGRYQKVSKALTQCQLCAQLTRAFAHCPVQRASRTSADP
jgi:hypothetical protein